MKENIEDHSGNWKP